MEDRDVESEVLLTDIELEVTERTDIDDVLCARLLDVLKVRLSELHSVGGESCTETSSCTTAHDLLFPRHGFCSGCLDEIVKDVGVLRIVQLLDFAGLEEVASIECCDLILEGFRDLGFDCLDTDLVVEDLCEVPYLCRSLVLESDLCKDLVDICEELFVLCKLVCCIEE